MEMLHRAILLLCCSFDEFTSNPILVKHQYPCILAGQERCCLATGDSVDLRIDIYLQNIIYWHLLYYAVYVSDESLEITKIHTVSKLNLLNT